MSAGEAFEDEVVHATAGGEFVFQKDPAIEGDKEILDNGLAESVIG